MLVCIFDFGIKLDAGTTIPHISHTRTWISTAPMAPSNKYSVEDSSPITDLINLLNKSPKLIKSTEHATPVDPNIFLGSWKMNEYKYHELCTLFPTLTRGLFLMELPESNGKNGEKRYHIVVQAMTSSLILERFLGSMCVFVFMAHS